jgi:hypothetical protein
MTDKHSNGYLSFLKKYENISGQPKIAAILFIFLGILVFLRRPDAILNAQPWAEDGSIFLQQAIQSPSASIFTPYMGYLHLIPRLVTIFALQFGLANAPLIMNLFALAISVVCAAYIFSADFRFLIKNDLLRLIASVFIICAPVSEIWMNITNVQWFLLVYITLWVTYLLFNKQAADKEVNVSFLCQIIFLCFAILSTPSSFILLPGLAVGLYLRLKGKDLFKPRAILLLAPAACMLLHIGFYVLNRQSAGGVMPSLLTVLKFISAEIVSWFTLIGSSSMLTSIGYIPIFAAAAVFLLLLGYVTIKRGEYLPDAWFIFLIVVSVLTLIIERRDYMGIFSANTVFRGTAGGRYIFLSVILLMVIVLRNVDLFLGKPGYIVYIPLVLLLIFTVNVATHYEQQPLADLHFKTYASLYDPKGNSIYDIPINPAGWFLQIPYQSGSNVSSPIPG